MMFSGIGFSKRIAWRYLWTRRKEAFVTIITVISILGVAIGVMVLNITMAVMTGFEKELKERLADTNAHVFVRAVSGRLEDWQTLARKIAAIEGVENVSPFTQHQALLRTRNNSSGLLIRGVKQGTWAAEQLARYAKEAPEALSLFDPPEVLVEDGEGQEQSVKLPGLIIGRELARTMGLYKGSVVSILTPQVSSTPFGLVPRFRRFVIAGVYSSGLIEYESGLAYAKLEDAQAFFGFGPAVSGLEVRVYDINDSPRITQLIMEKLGGASAGIYARDWAESNQALWDAIKLEKNVYFIVLLLIVVMASFSIITTLIMLVLEKRKDIAVLKTLGATTPSIRGIFILHGAVIGALGTTLGLLLGYLGCVALREYGFPLDERVFQMSTVPVRIEFWNFAMVGLSAFVICCLSTIYPARRAAKLPPVEILRYE